jgi:phage N-6-adenine-methyltransferase
MAPKQKPGRSRQDYATPPEFIAAVRRRLNIENFNLDVAANPANAVCVPYFTEEQDALSQATWNYGGWSWLNPPYANITPWVDKAWEQSMMGAQIAMLIPASVGANWWAEWVHNKAHTIFLNGRLCFDGKNPYPKDCALLLYTPYVWGGYEVWDWRNS